MMKIEYLSGITEGVFFITPVIAISYDDESGFYLMWLLWGVAISFKNKKNQNENPQI